MYLKRTITPFILKTSRQFPVILVTGPRQVGKTTCLQHAKEKDRTYVTLDDPQARALAKEEPGLFLQRFAPPVLIDEIQYAPELLPFIKMDVDRHKRSGQYWLTGSQQLHLMENVSESLAGRIGILNLLGFSYRELKKKSNLTEPFSPQLAGGKKNKSIGLMSLYEIIWRGSFPAIAINSELDRDIFFSSYVQTYLQRDVRALTNIGDEISFLKFLRATASRTAQLLNLSDLARDAGISPNTAKNWLSILRASGIVYLLEPYYTNVSKRIVKAPKLYFLDTGLAAYLTEWTSPKTLEAGAMSGAIFETWVIAEIIKSYWHSAKSLPLYYYRDADKKEIDLLIVRDGEIYPVEIKKTSSPTKDDIRHFSALNKFNMPIGVGCVICMTETTMPITESVLAISALQI